MRRLFVAVLVLAILPAPRSQVEPTLLAGMKARSIGPAGMSGRVAAVTVGPGDPKTIYVGAASGGLWRSSNAGLTWQPLFDDQDVQAIGAVAVDPRNPDRLWVGTGEGNPRNSTSVGNGLYRSNDRGETWQNIGLEASERIHRIILHPHDADVVWVAAMGPLWGAGLQRGVFKTEDGGASWRNVLFVNESTGCADLVLDPRNPDKLIAAMWHHRRWPWSFRSGGEGSGLYVTHDGGATWKQRTHKDGLPEGELGRMGIAIAPSEPDRVYVLVEAKDNALLRSDDGGRSFRTVNKKHDVAPRPFYYGDIYVDPERPDRIYSLHSLITVSDDGGKSFDTLVPFRDVHPDHHAMWIDPADAAHLLIGNDGGVAESHDRGKTWRFVANLPLAQFYHLDVDMDVPYHVFGGLQDNGSWRGPSQVWENGGIRNHHWDEVGFGDGFRTLPDPGSSAQGYAMSQEGYLMRWNLDTGERKSIRPAPPGDEELRFNWNAALAIDPFAPATIYFGSQFVHRSYDRGETWEVISPDLTTDRDDWQQQDQSGGLTLDVTGAENFTSLIVIAPSTIQQGVLWAGTDDGRIHLTKDGGESWTSVEANLPHVPANTWVPRIEPNRFDPASAFVVLDDHRRSNLTPYVLRTDDWGATWTSLVTDDLRGYALSIVQDPELPDLLFLGTEFGLWFSLNGGGSWTQFDHGIPSGVSVQALLIHPREHDLVIGTHGRAAYVVDDIRPFRELAAGATAKPLHLFTPPPCVQHRIRQTGASRFPGHGEFRGANRPYGALLTVWIADPELPHPDAEAERQRPEREPDAADDEKPDLRLLVEVRNEQGELIRTFKRKVKQGVNRFAWDLRRKGYRRPRNPDRERDEDDDDEPAGPEVLPGKYLLTVKFRDLEATATVDVQADPRTMISTADRLAKDAAQDRTGRLQQALADAIDRITDLRADLDTVQKTAAKADEAAREDLQEVMERLRAALTDIEKKIWTPPKTKGIPPRDHASSRVRRAARALGSSWAAPNSNDLRQLELAEAAVREVITELNGLIEGDVAALRQEVEGLDLRPVRPAEPVKIEDR